MSIRGVLLDLSGVLYVGNKLLPNALESMDLLRKLEIPHCFITNTTRSTRNNLLISLAKKGIDIPEDSLFTAPLAAQQYIKNHNLTPFLLIHPDLHPEFSEFTGQQYDAVLLGDAGSAFTYENLNTAFRILLDGAKFIAMGDNRYFKEEAGFSLDAGPFVRALEFACQSSATVVGKPSKEFFLSAIKDFGCLPEQVVMIGDDVEADINGATAAKLQGILVQTGKYRDNDDQRITSPSTKIVKNIGDAVAWIAEQYSG